MITYALIILVVVWLSISLLLLRDELSYRKRIQQVKDFKTDSDILMVKLPCPKKLPTVKRRAMSVPHIAKAIK